MKFIAKRNEGELFDSFIFYQFGNHIQIGFQFNTKYRKRHIIFGYSKPGKRFYCWYRHISKIKYDLEKYLNSKNPSHIVIYKGRVTSTPGFIYAPYIPILRNKGPIV